LTPQALLALLVVLLLGGGPDMVLHRLKLTGRAACGCLLRQTGH
jgi:hypothetical protein